MSEMNKESKQYRRAFSALKPQTSVEASFYAASSAQKKRKRGSGVRRAIVAVCAAAAVAAGGSVAYATNVGGIQRTIQRWQHGELTTATMVLDESTGSYELYDENGEFAGGGGGIAYEPDGTVRPLTAAELEEHFTQRLDVETYDDGRMYLYCGSQRIDITDKFDDDGYCYVTVQDGDTTRYVTIAQDGGFAEGTDRYPIPGVDVDFG